MRGKSAARSIADVRAGLLVAQVDLPVPPERVFQALTTAEEIVSWWGSEETYRTQRWTADLHEGGAWTSEGVGADGTPFKVTGTYLQVDAPHHLVQTWKPEWEEGAETLLTYDLRPAPEGTRLTLRHDGFGSRSESCAGHAQSWKVVLGWLSRHFAPAGENTDGFYLCRLLPPRSSFAYDMTSEEAAVMQAHAGYWTERLREGRAVVFGPVADPKGAWGLGIVRAPDEKEVKAFEAGDPAIRSGRGFSYDVLPMLQAVYEA